MTLALYERVCLTSDSCSNSGLTVDRDVSFKVLERVVPSWMGNSVGVFKSAALSGDNGKCKKYTCEKK